LITPGRIDTVLNPAIEQDLHPDTDSQNRSTSTEPLIDDPRALGIAQAGHTCGEGTNSWDDETIGI
jgi:hypothetical protein